MTTLITGADGYLGQRITAALDGEDLILAVRCADETELARKRARLARITDAPVVPVDLREADPFAHLDPRRITRIIHAAAVIRFDVSRDTADQVNVAGTARLREFAQRCDRLDRLMLLSTLYSAGRRRGEVHEIRHDDTGFVNHYEWSKWLAEECLLEAPGLPVTVARLPTVIAEDTAGAVGQYNAFHHTIRLYHCGLLTLLPGDPATPLSLATAEFTVNAVTALLAASPGIYQVCSGPVTLGSAIDTAFAVFERDPGFRRRMLPRPIPCDRDSFHDMAQAARRLRGGSLQPALASVAPFAEQLYLPKHFRTDRLRAAWHGYQAQDATALVEAACADLIERSFRVTAD
ncbi:SDR family oxidoreductase [Catellatospora tritici]|uniref:SDR family oxidoreductase n=1 Tax=Catellatospora tritici TaxID=2851566 RepID=UPI001C2DC031|nr:SDR family oxidoreductase [Catellatospora tritici]MBV1855902.1 SDR family oxidoreductase [Catellatospora tritici]